MPNTASEYFRSLLLHIVLSLHELQTLAGLEEISDMDDLKRLVHLCGSFLTIRDDHIYLIHQSAKDFLTTNASPRIFPAEPGPIHFDMFSWSLAAMS